MMFRFVARVRLYGLFRQIRSGTGQSDQRRSRFSASSRTRGAEEAVYQGGAAVAAGVVALSEFVELRAASRSGLFRSCAHAVDAHRRQGQNVAARNQRTDQRAAQTEHQERRCNQPPTSRRSFRCSIRNFSKRSPG